MYGFLLPTVPFDTNLQLNPQYTSSIHMNDHLVLNSSLYKFLASIKGEIDNLQYEWDELKKYTNPYEFIHTNIPYIHHSVSKLHPLSRSFYKMIELCHFTKIMDDLPNTNTPITSFHLAEGPGGFIEALCYLRGKPASLKDTYYGITLVKNQSCVPGWNKSRYFLDRHPQVKLEFGSSQDGDLLKSENLKYCASKYAGQCHMITADGGFDFSVDYNHQEVLMSYLLLGQVAYAITCQKQGGHFILKGFDLFTKHSVDIMYLLSNVYERVYIVKPDTSRFANAEKYIVCKKFRLTPEQCVPFTNSFIQILEHLEQSHTHIQMQTIIKSLFHIQYTLPLYFVNKIEEVNSIFGQQQIEFILSTLSLIQRYQKHEMDISKLNILRDQNIQRCISWCQKYNIPYHQQYFVRIPINSTSSSSSSTSSSSSSNSQTQTQSQTTKTNQDINELDDNNNINTSFHYEINEENEHTNEYNSSSYFENQPRYKNKNKYSFHQHHSSKKYNFTHTHKPNMTFFNKQTNRFTHKRRYTFANT
jgi:hypothetical protein